MPRIPLFNCLRGRRAERRHGGPHFTNTFDPRTPQAHKGTLSVPAQLLGGREEGCIQVASELHVQEPGDSQGAVYLHVPAFRPAWPCPLRANAEERVPPNSKCGTRPDRVTQEPHGAVWGCVPGRQPDALMWPSLHAVGPVVTVRSAHYQARGHSWGHHAVPCTWL